MVCKNYLLDKGIGEDKDGAAHGRDGFAREEEGSKYNYSSSRGASRRPGSVWRRTLRTRPRRLRATRGGPKIPLGRTTVTAEASRPFGFANINLLPFTPFPFIFSFPCLLSYHLHSPAHNLRPLIFLGRRNESVEYERLFSLLRRRPSPHK